MDKSFGWRKIDRGDIHGSRGFELQVLYVGVPERGL